MEHLSEDLLSGYFFDQTELSPAEADHLAACPLCRGVMASLRELGEELRISRASEPPPSVRDRAYGLFAQIQQQPSWLARMVRQLQATLLWDSRQSLAAPGLRTTATDRYHLLYTTEQIEVEVSVEPAATGLKLEGDLLPLAGVEAAAPFLLQLQPQEPGAVAYETQSDDAGHFRWAGVAPGRYQLLITPANGALLEITGLEFA